MIAVLAAFFILNPLGFGIILGRITGEGMMLYTFAVMLAMGFIGFPFAIAIIAGRQILRVLGRLFTRKRPLLEGLGLDFQFIWPLLAITGGVMGVIVAAVYMLINGSDFLSGVSLGLTLEGVIAGLLSPIMAELE